MSDPDEVRMPDFRALFESAPGLYLVLDADLTIVAVNAAYLRATMTERDAILGRPIFDVFPDNPSDTTATGVSNLRSSLERVLRSGQRDAMAVQKYDIRRPESEGGGFEVRHWSPINSPVLGDDGRVQYIIHAVEDVTEFVRLRQAESDQGERTAQWFSQAARMEAEIYRRAQELQEANRQLRLLHARLEERVDEQSLDLQQAALERQQTAEALRRSEEQLRHAQKLEAVGRLAGGIAHDFNNLLSVILGYGESLLAGGELPEPAQAELSQMVQAGQRAAALTRQLLAFSRQQVLEPRVLDLNEVLRVLERLLGRLLGEDIELRLALAPTLGAVRADRGQLEQVIMNLVVNARDAMPQGGRLTLETADVELGDAYATAHFEVRPGPYVLLSVSDTGVGMDHATQERAFEPFFTTKGQGRGTGLGLSTVFGIVKQSGGAIWLYSELGRGTTVKIYLPRVAENAEPLESPAARHTRLSGSETVLLAEDDDQVRAVASALLEHAGYTVLAAESPLRALELAGAHGPDIRLLLTDVIMPTMHGRELADRVQEKFPDIRVLFMSGYTSDVVLDRGGLDSAMAFVQKPFTAETLTRKVREVLDEVRPAAHT